MDNLPEGLQNLKFGCSFDQNINKLPKGLQRLKLGFFFHKQIKNYPENLKKISLHCTNKIINNLPYYLETLKIDGCFFNDDIQNINNFPINLKTLILKKQIIFESDLFKVLFSNGSNEINTDLIKVPFGCKIIKK